jgi:hypothetical protein
MPYAKPQAKLRALDNMRIKALKTRRLLLRDAFREGAPVRRKRVRFLRAAPHTPLPGGPGIDPLDTMVGVLGAWLRRER